MYMLMSDVLAILNVRSQTQGTILLKDKGLRGAWASVEVGSLHPSSPPNDAPESFI